MGKYEGSRLVGGDPARGIPTLLDPVQAEEHHEPGPLTPFEPGPPLPAGTTPPPHLFLHVFGKGQGLEDRNLLK